MTSLVILDLSAAFDTVNYNIRLTCLDKEFGRGVPWHFLFVSLGGGSLGEIQYGRVSTHKESPRREMLGGSGDMPSRKILKI